MLLSLTMVTVNIAKLEEYRKRAGLSKSGLCKVVGIHPSTYTLILARKRENPETIKRIALAVGLKPEKAWKHGRKSDANTR